MCPEKCLIILCFSWKLPYQRDAFCDAPRVESEKILLQRFEGTVELPVWDVLSFKWFYRYEDNRADGTAFNDFTYDRHLIGMEITGRVE